MMTGSAWPNDQRAATEVPRNSGHPHVLGRTMWDFPGGPAEGNRYLVLGLGSEQVADLAVAPDSDELIAYGSLLSDDDTAWLGTAALVRAPDPHTARTVLTPDRYAEIDVHNWRFGGRPS